MYIYYTMAPGTDAQKSSQALTWIYALVTQRTSTTRCIQRAEPSYGHGEMWRLHGTARLPAESSLLELPTQQSFKRTFDNYNAYPQNYSSFSTYLSYLSLEGRGHR